MNFISEYSGAHLPEPVHTGAHMFEQEWLDVSQAVVLCAEKGLVRTPKTLRKWAERSSGLHDGDVLSRKEDTPWGYRWLIEKASLERKVDEELNFLNANQPEPLQTRSPEFSPDEPEQIPEDTSELSANPSERVRAGAAASAPSDASISNVGQAEPGAHRSAPVQTRSEIELVLEEVRARMSDKESEISFLRDQLAEAQIEIGRRAASTDEALKTIDRVVRSFEMQAEANRALALGAGQNEPSYGEQPSATRFSPRAVDNGAGHQDIRRV